MANNSGRFSWNCVHEISTCCCPFEGRQKHCRLHACCLGWRLWTILRFIFQEKDEAEQKMAAEKISTPHISNLNPDPMLTGMIVHILKEGLLKQVLLLFMVWPEKKENSWTLKLYIYRKFRGRYSSNFLIGLKGKTRNNLGKVPSFQLFARICDKIE